MRGLVTALALIAALSGPAPAQQAAESSVPTTSGTSTILTLDQERLFEESQWGQRALAEINADSSDLAAENRRIEAELSAEEQDLANRRATMAAQEFRALADAFDAKVVEIRRNQDAKLRDLNRLSDAERQAFFTAVAPILRDYLLASEGAVAILDRRAILVAADAIDITDEAIALVDTRLGAGQRPTLPPEQN